MVQGLEGVVECLVFPLFSLEFIVHGFYLAVVAFKFTKNHLFIDAALELFFDLIKVLLDFGEFVRVCFGVFCFVDKKGSFVTQLCKFGFEIIEHGFEVCLCDFVSVDHVVVAVLADGAAETNAAATVFAEALYLFIAMLCAA